MSKRFDELVNEALAVEREIRGLSGDKPSIRGWVDACLKRGLDYEDVEAVKERLGGDYLKTRAVDSGAYLRDVRKYIKSGSMKEPPEAARITKMYFSQRDGAVAELGGEPRMLFALIAVAAESVYQDNPEFFGGVDDIDGHKELGGEPRMLFALIAVAAESVYQDNPEFFGGVDDIDGHKAKVAQLAARREELHKKIPTSWDNSDVVIGRIGSDFAALISWRRAPDIAVGMGVEALVDELLDGGGAEAKAA